MVAKTLLAALLMAPAAANAQDDPIVMKVNGIPVPRSEFEYSYNKNNTGEVADPKGVAEYVPMFVNYKLKVEAAKKAGVDTTEAFKREFAMYRDQQVRPSFITDADIEAEALRIYEETRHKVDSAGGMVDVSHIMMVLPQSAGKEVQDRAKQRIDSIYSALEAGAPFADLATRLSEDKATAVRGGKIGWITSGQAIPEFENAAYALAAGEYSKPVLSPAGYHIIKVDGRQGFYPYDTLRADILKYIDQRGLREALITGKIDSIAKAAPHGTTAEDILEAKAGELSAGDIDLKYLIKEYHDGLMLYEVNNARVWDKAAKDEAGLEDYFKANKKKYKWDTPRYKGMAYKAKDKADIKAVRKAVKGLPFRQWKERLAAFNNDSIRRIRVDMGLFKQGDNAIVDREVFKKDTAAADKGYPYEAVYGKKLKAPKEMEDVRQLVIADYQEQLEKEWVEELRREFPVEIYDEAIKTVNNH